MKQVVIENPVTNHYGDEVLKAYEINEEKRNVTCAGYDCRCF